MITGEISLPQFIMTYVTEIRLQIGDAESEPESEALQRATFPLAATERQSQAAGASSAGAEPAALQTGQQQ